MQPRVLQDADPQLDFEFKPMSNPADEAAQRAAYKRLQLSRRLTFEQVMANRALAIGIRNLADAIARRVKAGSTARIRPR